MKMKANFVLLTIVAMLFIAAHAKAQDMAHSMNVAQMKMTTIPPFPTCARASVVSGDPSKDMSVISATIATGCTIPWHWHTPTERVMITGGVARIDIKDQKSVTLSSGGYAEFPSKHVHQFHCNKACQIFVYSDAPFDLHYVDAKGTVISPAVANKAVKQTAATEMK